ncbi:2-keto-3-deoxygluconate kinase [Acrocarpospora phusangensis]|uniref:2-keto-3-deoxygluconate kinase n=1 Tax=Acrocarpospora phusangensis TaxID=1070424 RepID=A0A919QBD6_9ACTN|nr:sugar kinase [Acrocarpospora phusangensis]GIH24240.1 2-keto-3-deoxygluconate kinase [Acrocarpospora phusangensis]
MDVVVMGEPLVEFSADRALTEAETFRLSFSGDALNVAVAAAAAGARTALVTLLGEDEFGARLIRFAGSRGVDTRWMLPGPGSTGAYAVGADPSGTRAFAYMRQGSAASRLSPADLAGSPAASCRVLVLSGITAALSGSCDTAVRAAARAATGLVVYDPNYRSRLTGPEAAMSTLAAVAPHTALLKISAPGDSLPLLGTADPAETARRVRRLGAPAVAVTLGARGVLLDTGDSTDLIPAAPAPMIVDQTGAGDNFTGALAAWLSRDAPLLDAVRAGTAAASISLAGQGGTGRVATTPEIQTLLAGTVTGA